MNSMIENYLSGVQKEIEDRAIEILANESAKALENALLFEAENPSIKIPRKDNILSPAYCQQIRGVIQGTGTAGDAVVQTIADNQIDKALKERVVLWAEVKDKE